MFCKGKTYMNQYTIKFENTKTYYDFFECIIKGLNFPSWCGKNSDAIWDLITSDLKLPAIIYIEGSETIHKSLEEKYKQILELFNEAEQWYKNINCYLEIKVIS